jgi:hypothetical protein
VISIFLRGRDQALILKTKLPLPPLPPNQGNTTMSNTLSTLRALIVSPRKGNESMNLTKLGLTICYTKGNIISNQMNFAKILNTPIKS